VDLKKRPLIQPYNLVQRLTPFRWEGGLIIEAVKLFRGGKIEEIIFHYNLVILN